MSPKWPLPFRFFDQNFITVSYISIYATCASHLSISDFFTLTLGEGHESPHYVTFSVLVLLSLS